MPICGPHNRRKQPPIPELLVFSRFGWAPAGGAFLRRITNNLMVVRVSGWYSYPPQYPQIVPSEADLDHLANAGEYELAKQMKLLLIGLGDSLLKQSGFV